MRLTILISLCVVPAGVASCGTNATTESRSDAAPAADSLAPPPDDQGLQLVQRYASLPPNSEVHNCQLYTLPNRVVDVQRFEHTYTFGGHHIILYPTHLNANDVARNPGVFDCDTVMPDRAILGFSYVGGATSGEQTYPDGTAWHFDAGEVVMLESHMLNLGNTPLDVEYRLNLLYATKPVVDHVGTIFFYDNNIYIPPAGRATASMRCAVPSNIHVVALAPHMHVRGTAFRTQLVGGDLTSPLALPGSDNWAATEATQYDPPLEMSAGQTVEFHCDYANADPTAIVSGGSKTKNEMCLLIGSYYPKIDFPFEFCMGPGSGPVYDGSNSCSDTFGCFASSGNVSSVEAQECVTRTCPASSQAFNDFFACSALHCALAGKCATTADGGSNCQSCTLASCKAELSACLATGCQGPGADAAQ